MGGSGCGGRAYCVESAPMLPWPGLRWVLEGVGERYVDYVCMVCVPPRPCETIGSFSPMVTGCFVV